MIEKLPDFKIYSFHNNHKIVDKVNEIIDVINGLLDEETIQLIKRRQRAKEQEAEGYHP